MVATMRVLMVSKACLVGIYQRKLEEMAPHLSEFRVLVPPYWKDERGVTPLERAFTNGYDLRVTPMRFNGRYHLHYYPEFGRELREFRPDLVHIDEEPYNLATWLALRATKQLGAKSLFFSWQNIKRRYPPPVNGFERWVLRSVDYALMGTESAAEVWRAKGYAKPLAVVPQFGVDPNLFHPAPHKRESIHIGYVGRLVHEKGIDLLLDALSTLHNHPWQLSIVGSGPQRAALEAQAASLDGRVNFLGSLPSVEMPAIFQQFDVVVVPSRTMPNWKEQFGRVIIEAMASGVAVIGSDSGAIPDVIGKAGLTFGEDDSTDLAEKLAFLMQNPAERARLAQAGREHVLANYTQSQVAQQTVAAYQAMLSNR